LLKQPHFFFDSTQKSVTAAARNVQKFCGLAEWLRNHLVGADGTCPDHRRTMWRLFSESYGGTLDTPYRRAPRPGAQTAPQTPTTYEHRASRMLVDFYTYIYMTDYHNTAEAIAKDRMQYTVMSAKEYSTVHTHAQMASQETDCTNRTLQTSPSALVAEIPFAASDGAA
jgi:hypothetical protein